MNEFGDFLKELRISKKLSIRKASEGVGISHTYLDSLEKGYDPRTDKERKPTPDVIKKISRYYNESYIEMLKKAGYMSEAFEGMSIDSTSKKKATLSLPNAIEVFNSEDGTATTIDTRPEHIFDLYYIFKLGFHITYKNHSLTEVEKEKVQMMLKTILE